MFYIEHIPSPELRHAVKLIWALEDDPGAVSEYEKILPDGCPELIFHYGDPFLNKENDEEQKQVHSFVYGQILRFIELKPAGKIGVVGVKFHPWGLALLTNIPQYRFNHREIAIEDIFDNPNKDISQKIAEAKTMKARITLIENFLLGLLHAVPAKKKFNPKPLRFAVECLNQQGGFGRIGHIANSMNISRRELERKFEKNIGLTPKQMARIFHFQSVFKLKDKVSSLTELAHAAGYYDQSHFIHSFKEIAGINPQTFFKQDNKLTDVFIQQ